MRTATWFFGLLAITALCIVGCSKKEVTPPTPSSGVDIPKLQQAFANNTEGEVQQAITDVSFGMRYGDPVKALMALDKLAALPSITEPQKQIVNATIEAVKKLAAQQPAPAQ